MFSVIFWKVALVHCLGDNVQNNDYEEDGGYVPNALQHVLIWKSIHLVAETPEVPCLNHLFSQLIPTED